MIDCVPDKLWLKEYCDMPMYTHIYHMLHSLDLWFINPCDTTYKELATHEYNLNNLDVVTYKILSRNEINDYYNEIKMKIQNYVSSLSDKQLLEYPSHCEYTKFTLILAQFRHLHTHMGMIMGFIVDDTNLWPNVLGLENPIPEADYKKYC
ncbi:MAG: hypothetical protein LUG12_03910 [Erysipelotrichaceae bacterium]|nr:hypothetical protein [Erysipelotrichaceae bacterium]